MIRYNGVELKEITERPQAFEPHRMLCWNADPTHPLEEFVIAIVKRSDDMMFITDHSVWPHGAEIPEKPKMWATNRQLSKWLAQGNGECIRDLAGDCLVQHEFQYNRSLKSAPVDIRIRVRRWGDEDWHEPTLEYMGLQE